MKISPFQMYEPKSWAGLTTENHLGAIYAQEPEVVSPMIEQIFNVNLGDDVMSYVNQLPIHYINDDVPFQWWLQGADEKNLPLIEAQNTAGTALTDASQAGLGRTQWLMIFPEDLFTIRDVLVGEKPDLYKVRIVDKSSHVLGVAYTVELMGTSDLDYVEYEDLVPSTRWSKDYSQVEQTLSVGGGSLYHTSPFKMENVLSMIRKEAKIPGNMIIKGKNKPLAFSFKDQNGKVQTSWINKLDWDFISQFRREAARLVMFGKSNRMENGEYYNTGESGYVIRSGAGVREQISPSNQYYYSTFDIDYLTDIMMNLSVGKLPEDKRRFVIGTGEYGLKLIDQAIQDKSGFITDQSSQRIYGSGQDLGFGGQFKRMRYINGIEFEVFKIPHYDDNVRNKLYHPDGGLAESRRMTIFDFGTTKGEPNIQKVMIKNEGERFRYIPGMRDPYSPGGNKDSNPSMAATSLDGYEIHRMLMVGAMVRNPLRIAEMIPTLLG